MIRLITFNILQDGIYYRLGQLAAVCLVHGGSPVRLLAPSVYVFLCGFKPADISMKFQMKL